MRGQELEPLGFLGVLFDRQWIDRTDGLETLNDAGQLALQILAIKVEELNPAHEFVEGGAPLVLDPVDDVAADACYLGQFEFQAVEFLAGGIDLEPEGVDGLFGRRQRRIRPSQGTLGVGGPGFEFGQGHGPVPALLEPFAVLGGQRDRLLLQLGDLPLQGLGGVAGEFDRLLRPFEAIRRRPEPGRDVGLLHLPVNPAFASGFLFGLERREARTGGAEGLILPGAGQLAVSEGRPDLGQPTCGLGDSLVEASELVLSIGSLTS